MDKPQAAFKDKKFLESPEGRSIRILAEYEKVKSVFELHKIIDTITFFGSARVKSKEDNNNLNDENTLCYEQARSLAHKFTTWSKEYSKDYIFFRRYYICALCYYINFAHERHNATIV